MGAKLPATNEVLKLSKQRSFKHPLKYKPLSFLLKSDFTRDKPVA